MFALIASLASLALAAPAGFKYFYCVFVFEKLLTERLFGLIF